MALWLYVGKTMVQPAEVSMQDLSIGGDVSGAPVPPLVIVRTLPPCRPIPLEGEGARAT